MVWTSTTATRGRASCALRFKAAWMDRPRVIGFITSGSRKGEAAGALLFGTGTLCRQPACSCPLSSRTEASTLWPARGCAPANPRNSA
jgi:hypothetical protein